MSFIKTLTIPINNFSEQNIIDFEEFIFTNIKEFISEFKENEVLFYKQDFLWKDEISFNDYKEIWILIKSFLIENNIADGESYKNFFILEKIEIQSNKENNEILPPDELDNLIAKVPEDDPKLNEVLNFLNKIKKD